jgi:ABC-type sugar transport system ATPase subunit
MLIITNLEKNFGNLRALDRVSLEVERESIVGLIGPNGSGKTTLFNVVSGFYEKDGGEVYFKGERIDGLTPDKIAKKGLCRTFQVSKAPERLTVLENMMLAAKSQVGENPLGALFMRPRVALIPPTHNFDQRSLMSDWSHRHVAYAAGIGGFGAHNLIITEKGCTGRLGSLVTDLALEASPPSSQEFCLQKAGTDCLKCVKRCRYGALYANRFDRHACYRQCLFNDQCHRDLALTDVCEKCSTMVPCSVANPVKDKEESNRR